MGDIPKYFRIKSMIQKVKKTCQIEKVSKVHSDFGKWSGATKLHFRDHLNKIEKCDQNEKFDQNRNI